VTEETNAENSPTSIPEGHEELWDFVIHVGLRGGDDLRQAIGLNECSFRHVAPYAHAQPSRCYVYRVLDEVQKAAICMMQWKEYVSGGLDFGGEKSEQQRLLGRLGIEAVLDDQQFRARKLAETLVDSILFSTTNDEAHYRDYFYLYDLNESSRSQEDREEFFGFQNRNTASHASWILGELQKLEQADVCPSSRWYLRKGRARCFFSARGSRAVERLKKKERGGAPLTPL